VKRSRKEAILRRLVCCVIAALGARQTQAAEIDFSGKSLTIAISSGVGGATDGIARIFGRYLSDYLPGKPTVIFQNIPGAGGITGVNYLVKQVKPDGLTSMAGSASDIDPTVLRKAAVQYSPKQLLMYGGFPSPSSLVILRKAAVKQFEDRSLKPAIMGEVNAERGTGQMATWGPRFLNWNVRWVLGYAGTPDLVLAVKRGEIDMIITYGDGLLEQFRNDGNFVFPAQTGDVKDGKYVRNARFPDVPLFAGLIEPKLKTAREKKAFAAWETIEQSGKWFALPPGTPAKIVDLYRKAFDEIVKNPNFIADASRVLGAGYTVETGQETQQLANAGADIGDDELAFFEDLRQRVGIPASR
jgi:hypothetical protein